MSIFLRARRGSAAFFGMMGLVALFSCTALPDVDHGICGNHVVDDATEDCDQQTTQVAAADGGAVTTKSCRAPGTVGQCRYDCSQSEAQCPTGWGCGTDKICRQATGNFEKLTGILPFDLANHLKSADFDGDDIQDVLVWNEDRGLRIYYGDATGRFSETFDLPPLSQGGLGGLQLAVGHVAGNPQSDVVLSADNGVAVLEGTSDRQLLPIANSSFEIGNSPTRIIGLDMQPSVPGDEILLYTDTKSGHIILPVNGVGFDETQVLVAPEKSAQAVAGEIYVGQLNEATACDELAFAYAEDKQAGTKETTVSVYSSCDSFGRPNTLLVNNPAGTGTPVPNPRRINLPKVKLPTGFFLRDTARETGAVTILDTPFRIGDLNGDGHLDMALSAQDASGEVGKSALVYVAYGVGDGTFNSKPPTGPGPGDGVASPDPGYFRINQKNASSEAYPLAFGQMTRGDNVPDFVFPGGIVLATVLDGSLAPNFGPDGGVDASTVTSFYDNVTIGTAGNETFSEAHIGDFNNDGTLDVVVSTGEGLATFIGTGGRLMNRTSFPVSGKATNLVSGDFDGDGARDIAFRQEGTPQDTLAILFGRFGASPEGVQEVGRLGTIQLLDSVVLGASQGSNDAISDLAVVSSSRDGQHRFISVLQGATDRRIVSALFLRDQVSTGDIRVGVGTSYGIGQFAGDENLDVASMAFDSPNATGGASAGVPSDFNFRLWPLQGLGEGALEVAPRTGAFVDRPLVGTIGFTRKDSTGTLTGTGFYPLSVMGAIDLDPPGPGIDELVALVPPLPTDTGGGQGSLQISDFDAANGIFKPRPVVNLGAPVGASYFGDPIHLHQWQLDFADLDGNGSKDMAVEFSDEKGGVLQVYLNTQKHDLPAPKVVPLPQGKNPRGFAFLNADADPQLEIAVLCDDGVYLADVSPQGDLTVNPGALSGVPGGGFAISAGDFDGDGIDDLALVPKEGGGFKIFKGEARLR